MNIEILKKLSSELSVLLIDEDELFLDLFASTLSSMFKTLYRAKTPSEGEAIYHERFCDVVMIDIESERKNGFALVASIRRHSIIVPIIGLGKANTDDKITECLIAGMDECLEKSVGMNVLVKTLYSQLRKYQIKGQIDQKDQFINTLLASAKIGIAVLDTEGNYTDCNESYALMMGQMREEMVGKTWQESSDMREREKIAEAFSKVLKEGYVDSFRQIHRLDKEHNATLDITLYLLPQKQKILMSVKDMTKEMNYMDELERASKAKDIFLANMSHEIRTPLNGVIGIVDILSNTPLSDKQREYVGLIQNSSASLLSIINDILDYSKIEAGKFTLERYPFSPAQILRNAVELFRYSANKNGTDLEYSVKFDDSLRLLGDPHRLAQIVNNLVGNAVKFTQNGSIKVVGSAQEKKSRVWLTLRVVDTGIGMNSEHLHTLFTPFNQGDPSNSRQYGGTGLGLAICKELCTLMEGEITAQSKPAQGSTFRVSIPFERSYEIRDEESEGSAVLRHFQAKGRVLVVDDNETNLIVATEYLSRYGLGFETAHNGAEAVEKVEKGAFDLVLMDVQMPIMDGHEATRKIRAFNTAIPIIGLSASAMKEDHALCLAVGMNDNVPKPIVPETLEKVLAAFLNHEWREEESSEPPIPPTASKSLYGVDETALRKKFRTDEKIHRFLKLFAAENRDYERSIEEARGDYEELRRRLHYLKGVSGNASMSPLFEMCSDLYALNSLDAYEKGFPAILEELRKILDSIEKSL
jgi:PAS domain S-box-containing protein